MRKIFTIVLAVFVILSLTTMTFAASERMTKAVDSKMGRGAKNLALGWTEIPKEIVGTTKKNGAIVGITIGTVKGVLNAVARTLSGAVDVATFPVGSPDKPVVKPSMVPEAEK